MLEDAGRRGSERDNDLRIGLQDLRRERGEALVATLRRAQLEHGDGLPLEPPELAQLLAKPVENWEHV
jgi:hypothetical protein